MDVGADPHAVGVGRLDELEQPRGLAPVGAAGALDVAVVEVTVRRRRHADHLLRRLDHLLALGADVDEERQVVLGDHLREGVHLVGGGVGGGDVDETGGEPAGAGGERLAQRVLHGHDLRRRGLAPGHAHHVAADGRVPDQRRRPRRAPEPDGGEVVGEGLPAPVLLGQATVEAGLEAAEVVVVGRDRRRGDAILAEDLERAALQELGDVADRRPVGTRDDRPQIGVAVQVDEARGEGQPVGVEDRLGRRRRQRRGDRGDLSTVETEVGDHGVGAGAVEHRGTSDQHAPTIPRAGPTHAFVDAPASQQDGPTHTFVNIRSNARGQVDRLLKEREPRRRWPVRPSSRLPSCGAAVW